MSNVLDSFITQCQNLRLIGVQMMMKFFFGHFIEHMACIPISNTQRVRDHFKNLLEIHENYALGAKNHSITSNLNQPKQKV